MNSHIINVNVKGIGLDFEEQPYETFIDYIMNNNDYHNINIKYYIIDKNNINKSINDEHHKKNIVEFNKFIDKLKILYKQLKTISNKNNNKIMSGVDKINKLTNDRIYHYIYTAIILNNKLLSKHKIDTELDTIYMNDHN